MFKKIVIFGVGLIGGSFALALKKSGHAGQIIGMERDAAALIRAKQLGIIDEAGDSLPDAIRDADLVLIAAPVAQTGAILAAIRPHLQVGTIVTDAGSTKSDVVEAARIALGDKIAQFIPGHPIAGREVNGPDAAIDDLFINKKTVLAPLPENAQHDVEQVAQAWEACGAIIHYLSAQEHDAVFATVSHLPHLLAYALVDHVAEHSKANLLFQYAASGFRDFTRIAGSSPEMWRDITLANHKPILVELDAYIEKLHTMREQVAACNGVSIEAVYKNAQSARLSWIRAIESSEKENKEGHKQ